MDKIYINHNKLDIMHKLRIKGDEYWALHNNEPRIYYRGRYTGDNASSQMILINGLSEIDLNTLIKIGCMPTDKFFDMHVKD